VTRFSGPFVTAVGGTTGIKPETIIYLTRGGSSDYFPRPSYQDKDVTAYNKNLETVLVKSIVSTVRLLALS